ncbi:MAG: universal stress protein [Acidimicrobiia bacterium]|nr:universal stress protein [Acidimicrobiia bacterium]MCL4292681.1 universal stress protein [Acidimicrobiia bacterium]
MSAGTPRTRIVVGVDGSKGSGRALAYAADVAERLGAEVVAVYGLGPLAELAMAIPPSRPTTWKRDLQDEMHDVWCRPLADRGVKFHARLVESDPVNALIDAADKEQALMIVVGANSRGELAHRVLGGVTYRLAHRAHHPVVIVPPTPDRKP